MSRGGGRGIRYCVSGSIGRCVRSRIGNCFRRRIRGGAGRGSRRTIGCRIRRRISGRFCGCIRGCACGRIGRRIRGSCRIRSRDAGGESHIVRTRHGRVIGCHRSCVGRRQSVNEAVAVEGHALCVINIKNFRFGTRDRAGIKENIGNRGLRQTPNNTRVGRGSRGLAGSHILKSDVVPVGRGAVGGRARIRGGTGGNIRIIAVHQDRINQNAGHGDVGISNVRGDSPFGVIGFKPEAVLGSVKNTIVDHYIAHPAGGDAADGKSMACPKGTTLNRDPGAGVGTANLYHIVPVADVTILDIDIGAAQIDPVRIGRRPWRRNGQTRSHDIDAVAEKLDMEFG